MKCDIILCGVGGQGILSISAAISMAALEGKFFLKQSEVHGMSQRGGAVQSHLRISSENVSSDLIPLGMADLIISMEPMEALRYLPWLSPEGWLITNSEPFINIDSYPDTELIYIEIRKVPNHVLINADVIASNSGKKIGSNMVILGAASNYIPFSDELLISGIRKIFSRKGEEMINSNIIAFKEGQKAACIPLSKLN
jgi:indolepyruvate ferredoxin oxidoreductase beta subunit